MTHSAPIEQPGDGDVAAPVLDAIQHGYEEAKASIIDRTRVPASSTPDGGEALPETEGIDLRTLPPVPTEAPVARFSGNFAVQPTSRRRWWRGVRSPRHGGGAGRR